MKGNLSKKKGFLKQLDENDLKSISDTLEVRFDKRLKDAENSVLDITQTTIPNLKIDLNKYTDDMVDEAYKGIENLEKATKGKEDVSNKVMAVDDDGRYYSGEMTEMRIYQVVDEHIVQDLNVPKEDRIPSVKAVSEAIKGIKPDIDLSDYYKKDEIDSKDKKLQQDIYDLQADIVGREEKSNKAIGGNMPITLAYKENTGLANDENYPSLKYLAECFEYFKGEIGGSGGSVDLSDYFTKDESNRVLAIESENIKKWTANEIKIAFEENKTDNIHDSLGSKKCPTVEAVHEQGQSLINSCNSFTAGYVAQEIGNIETALENIIEKYGLGGDAS